MSWLTLDQAAEVLQLTRETVRLMCVRGDIDGARKFGRVWRVPDTSIEPPPARSRELPLLAPLSRRSRAQQRRSA